MGFFKISHLQRMPPLSRLFKAQFGHTPFWAGHDLGTEQINQHSSKATQAALTKILPVEEDRFGK